MLANLLWNYTEGRLRALWRQVVQLLLLAILITPMTYVVYWFLLFFAIGLHWLFHIPASTILGLLELPRNSLISASSVILSIWISVRFFNREKFSLSSFCFSKVWWTDFFFGCVLGVVLNAAVFLVEWFLGWISIKQLFFNDVAQFPFAVVLCIGLVNFLLVALFEELLARGYPLRNFAQGFNIAPLGPQRAILLCWLLTSLVFGFGHYANPHVTLLELISISVAGLMIGLGYILTGSLSFSIGLHTAWNFAQGNIFGFSVAGQSLSKSASLLALQQKGPDLWTGGIVGPNGGLVSICAFLFGILSILFYVRLRYGKVTLSTSLAQFQRSVHRN